MRITNKWFVTYNQPTTKKYRLFCFPHAGGSASFFREWTKFLNPNGEIIGLQLPGREQNYAPRFVENISEITYELGKHFVDLQDLPYVFFGHSLGAILAFELARHLRSLNLNLPKYLIISSSLAPHLAVREVIHNLPEQQFIEKLIAYQGIPEEILENQEMLDFLLPRLRADFKIIETYQYSDEAALNCPLLILGGEDDKSVGISDLNAWRIHTTNNASTYLFPGGHFYMQNSKAKLFDLLNNLIMHNV